LLCWNSGRQRADELAARDDVGPGTEPRERPQHRLVAVGLDRVADLRRPLCERRDQPAVTSLDVRRPIDVDGGADLGGDRAKIHALDVEHAFDDLHAEALRVVADEQMIRVLRELQAHGPALPRRRRAVNRSGYFNTTIRERTDRITN